MVKYCNRGWKKWLFWLVYFSMFLKLFSSYLGYRCLRGIQRGWGLVVGVEIDWKREGGSPGTKSEGVSNVEGGQRRMMGSRGLGRRSRGRGVGRGAVDPGGSSILRMFFLFLLLFVNFIDKTQIFFFKSKIQFGLT